MRQTGQIQSARPKEGAALIGVGVSTFWRWAKERPDFPKPRKLSSRCTVFDVAELLAWRDAQIVKGAAHA